MRPYRVIFFDLDHTLVDTNRQHQLSLQRTVQTLYGGQVPQDFIPRLLRHHDALWKQYDERIISMQELRRQRFLRTWRDYGVERTDDEADVFNQLYMDAVEEALFAFPGTLAMLANLAADHQLGIITNGSPDLQWRKMQATGISKYIPESALIISEHVGAAKPHPSVYAAACAALSVAHGEALMVGDNYAADVAGAEACGLDALWYVPDAGMPHRLGERTAYRTAEEVVLAIRERELARP
ncbi:noncanonical pyrimidine nucleotidase, YjjG family protein [Alicyclobacillus contaminans]|uniref:HAD family hydrolase n=1 Tax=Alicyclobacillus contaminans TaxID=392016 RepID=UPI00042569CB|nr:HAD family hydrolase [Alicyclobacillus contaminans]GMA51697.1 noncanonical pyrimidine nucleotidase, YjjG family protein [Alicyclobacillus contaminans]